MPLKLKSASQTAADFDTGQLSAGADIRKHSLHLTLIALNTGNRIHDGSFEEAATALLPGDEAAERAEFRAELKDLGLSDEDIALIS